MTSIVLGATGYMGPHVVRRLLARGENVVAVSRGQRQSDLPAGAEIVAVDRGDPAAIRNLARDRKATTIVDMIAFTEASTLPLFDALAGEIERYVLISSCDVYRNYGGLLKLEEADPIPVSAEDSPLRASRYPRRKVEPRDAADPQRFQDEYEKIGLEEAVLAARGFAGVATRLPMVFGPRDHQRRFGWAIWRLKDGRTTFRMPAEIAGWRTCYGYVEDVAEAIALAALHPRAARRVYNVGRSDAPTQGEWVGRIAAAMGLPVDIVVDREGKVRAGLSGGLDLDFPLATDTSRIRAELGFAEILAEADALERTIADELERGRPEQLAAEYSAEDARETAA